MQWNNNQNMIYIEVIASNNPNKLNIQSVVQIVISIFYPCQHRIIVFDR